MAVHPYHLVAWVDRCRQSVAKLRADYPHLAPDKRLEAIRAQYVTISVIRNVCAGRTYFAGIPVERKPNG